MDIVCYILYSKSLDSYSVGYTSQGINERLKQHNTGFFGSNSFTSKSDDWEIYLTITCETVDQVVRIENHIKKMKS